MLAGQAPLATCQARHSKKCKRIFHSNARSPTPSHTSTHTPTHTPATPRPTPPPTSPATLLVASAMHTPFVHTAGAILVRGCAVAAGRLGPVTRRTLVLRPRARTVRPRCASQWSWSRAERPNSALLLLTRLPLLTQLSGQTRSSRTFQRRTFQRRTLQRPTSLSNRRIWLASRWSHGPIVARWWQTVDCGRHG